MENKIESIRNMIKNLGENEQDPPVRRFFATLSQTSDKNYLTNILIRILEKRPETTEEHLAYLIYISLQYLTDLAYDKETSSSRLERDLMRHSKKIIDLCQTKYASTNVIERYAMLQIILGIINKKCTVVDLGASICLGLMSLNTNGFSNISVDSKLRPYIKKKANISRSIGLDIQKMDLKWQSACYLPENKKDRIRLEKIYNRLKLKGGKVTLIQGNILELNKIHLPRADVIWTSNTLYQIEGNINEVIKNIQNILKEGGIWVNADYRYGDKKFATLENPYVAMIKRKEEWDNILEVLEAPSDVVKSIKPGRDFEKFKFFYE